jgi:hypothetical protein
MIVDNQDMDFPQNAGFSDDRSRDYVPIGVRMTSQNYAMPVSQVVNQVKHMDMMKLALC